MNIEDGTIATSLPKPSKTKAEHLHEIDQSFLQLDAALKRQNDLTGGMIVAKNMIIGNLSSLMTVCAFIGAVQAQVIDWTREENNTSLEVFTNFVSFFGLTLDILGVGTGVIRQLMLQHSVRRMETQVTRLRDNADKLQRQFHRLRSGSEFPDDLRGPRGQQFLRNVYTIRDQLAKQMALLDDMREIQRFRSDLILTDRVDDSEDSEKRHGVEDSSSSLLSLTRFDSPGQRRSTGRGTVMRFVRAMPHQLPMVSMGGGIFFLLCSVIWLATSTQPRVIWVPCLVAAAVTLVCTLVPSAWFYEGNMEQLLNEEIEAYEEHFQKVNSR
ncbi:hypothetical protein EYR40_004469 [Pleurotus pulmonarius]|nr:hypothetical protein EYR40_004469 [Pleurotus pulmonarius]KAF4607168.1 hypothetical protein EYR38_001228 [Pleurotus pulmonarius]